MREIAQNATDAPHEQKPPPAEPKKPPGLSPADLVQTLVGLSDSVASDYLRFRRAKKAPLNATAWRAICAEVGKSGIPPDEAIAEAMAAGWTGLKADWLTNRRSPPTAPAKPPNGSDLVDFNRRVAREAAERYRTQSIATGALS